MSDNGQYSRIITAYIPDTETFEIDLKTERKEEKNMIDCLSCKSGKMVDSTTTYTAVLGNCILIIKNVPCVKCKQCGDVLYNTDIKTKENERAILIDIYMPSVRLANVNRAVNKTVTLPRG